MLVDNEHAIYCESYTQESSIVMLVWMRISNVLGLIINCVALIFGNSFANVNDLPHKAPAD